MSTQEKTEGFFSIRGGEFDEAGASASELRTTLTARGVPREFIRRAGVVAFEAEMNVIIHALAGTLHYEYDGETITIVISDMGPGIKDVDQAMKEGYTTAPQWAKEKGWGSGLGLPNIKKNADDLQIDSRPGEGTTLTATIRVSSAASGAEGTAI